MCNWSPEINFVANIVNHTFPHSSSATLSISSRNSWCECGWWLEIWVEQEWVKLRATVWHLNCFSRDSLFFLFLASNSKRLKEQRRLSVRSMTLTLTFATESVERIQINFVWRIFTVERIFWILSARCPSALRYATPFILMLFLKSKQSKRRLSESHRK